MTPQRLTAPGAAPILVVGTTGDPATPYEWAKGLASQLSSGRLLTWEGYGHTAYGQGSSCVSRVGRVVPGRRRGPGTRHDLHEVTRAPPILDTRCRSVRYHAALAQSDRATHS